MDSRAFTLKNYGLFLLLLIDIAVNGLIDHQSRTINIILMVSAQFVTRLMLAYHLMYSVFTLMWSTFIVRHGLVGVVKRRFYWSFIIASLSFFLTIGFHVGRMVAKLTGTNYYAQWDDGTVFLFYILHNLLSVVFYASTITTAFQLGDPNLYKPHHWNEPEIGHLN